MTRIRRSGGRERIKDRSNDRQQNSSMSLFASECAGTSRIRVTGVAQAPSSSKRKAALIVRLFNRRDACLRRDAHASSSSSDSSRSESIWDATSSSNPGRRWRRSSTPSDFATPRARRVRRRPAAHRRKSSGGASVVSGSSPCEQDPFIEGRIALVLHRSPPVVSPGPAPAPRATPERAGR